jgi:hypothetical protein
MARDMLCELAIALFGNSREIKPLSRQEEGNSDQAFDLVYNQPEAAGRFAAGSMSVCSSPAATCQRAGLLLHTMN